MENLTHNEETLSKVMRTLISVGHHTQSEATEIISAMQNAGIKFREVRSDEEIKSIIEMGLKDVDISEAVHLTVGAASTCWEDMSNTGVFQDDRARDIANQLLFRIGTEIDRRLGSKDESPVAAEPKEWIERQEEERRAWAINTAVEARVADVIGEAKKMVDFVKGVDDNDLHDQRALDAFHLELAYVLTDDPAVADLDSEEMTELTTKAQDAITSAGVRFKNAKTA